MEMILYETAVSFNASCRKYLLLEEAKNNMFIGSLDMAMSIYRDEKYIFGEVKNQGQTKLLFMCNPKDQMFLYSPTHSMDNGLYEFLAKELCRAGVQVNSIKASPVVADWFASEYSKQTGRENRINMHMRILLLTKLKPVRLLPLEVKKITFEDDYPLSPEQMQFIREGLVGQEGLYFLIKNNVLVSQAAIRRKASMGGVYTPEEYRRNGYSSTLVYQLAKRILADGNPYCVIHTDADNFISNQMYTNMGFESIADMKDITFCTKEACA